MVKHTKELLNLLQFYIVSLPVNSLTLPNCFLSGERDSDEDRQIGNFSKTLQKASHLVSNRQRQLVSINNTFFLRR